AISYTDHVKSIKIPDTVTSIGYYAISDNSSLESVTLGKNVEYVGYGSFSYNSSLSTIEIPDSTKVIDYCAFEGCKNLTNIILGDNLDFISYSAFPTDYETLNYTVYENGKYIGSKDNKYLFLLDVIDKSQKTLTVHSNTKFIGYNTFKNYTDLEKISLPSSIVQIDANMLSACTNLQCNEYENGLYIGNDTNKYLAFVGMKDTSATSLSINKDTRIILSSALKGNDKIEEITLGNNIIEIGSDAFFECINLKKINLPDTVKNIEERAFFSCSSLSSISLNDNIANIGIFAFCSCKSLTELKVPNSLKMINSYSFYDCSALESLTIGENVTYIDYCSFSKNAIKTLIIPDSVRNIETQAFEGCNSLESIKFGKGLRNIGYPAFGKTSSLITEYEGANYLGSQENPYKILYYVGDNIENLSIHKDTEIIAGGFFYENKKIKKLILPNNVKSISYGAFNSLSLQSVTLNSGLIFISTFAFGTCPQLLEIYNLSSISIGKYSKIDHYHNAIDIYTSLDSPSKIQECDKDGFQFYVKNSNEIYLTGYFGEQTKLTLPDSYQGQNYKIHQNAFYGSKLTEVIISSGVTEIEKYAFRRSTNLEKVIISDSVQKVGNSCFSSCSSLISAVIGSQVELGSYVFNYCYALKSVVIRNKNISIPNMTFYGCNALSEIYYYGDASSWNDCFIGDELNGNLSSSTIYYYSENEPALNEEGTAYDDNYWKYAEDEITPVVWIKQ
ncbi:MAG: leucine-rich repeat protein, partial [Bacilli bacterium]